MLLKLHFWSVLVGSWKNRRRRKERKSRKGRLPVYPSIQMTERKKRRKRNLRRRYVWHFTLQFSKEVEQISTKLSFFLMFSTSAEFCLPCLNAFFLVYPKVSTKMWKGLDIQYWWWILDSQLQSHFRSSKFYYILFKFWILYPCV